MKKINIEVKSKGKVVGNIEIPQFDTIEEATKTLTAEKVLALVNRQYKSDLSNEFRAAQTRDTSPMTKLSKLAKTNPEVEKKINELIAKFVQ